MREPVAVIGLACRFPGAPDADAYWRLLREAGSGVGQVRASWYDPAVAAELAGLEKTADIGHGGFLPDPDLFDPRAFGISTREALEMDPQQRLLLEVALEAFEDAGVRTDRPSDTGVFIGISGTDYAFLKVKQRNHLRDITAFTGTGSTHSISANRISYTFDLKGPSLAIDTACSSSLVAIHGAMRSLVDGDCAMALAGGVNFILSPEVSVAFARAGMLSGTGQCWPFDARADGYVRGEGCGLLVLKRLADARRDGDRILALLHGSAVNQDGHTRGMTVPDPDAQVAVIRAALADAGVAPGEIGFVEAHGTGTPVGDPIEAQALSRVFQADGGERRTLPIGSVKASIGHLETASGVAGLIKAILALRFETLPPQANYADASPNCRLAARGIEVVREARPWPAGARGRFAGVSAYGFGGANAHVVVGEAPRPATACASAPGDEGDWRLVTVSTRNRAALPPALAALARHLGEGAVSLAQAARATTEGRAHHAYRRGFVASDVARLGELLAEAAEGEPPGRIVRAPRIAFLFTGQGAQYAGMARGLHDQDPSFRQDLEQCEALYRDLAGRSLLDVMFGDEAELQRTASTQPALFALGYALSRLWRRWGAAPYASFGHSVGEFAAACDAGLMSLEDGLRLVVRRAELMQALPPDGAMLSLAVDEAQALALIGADADSVAIAADNGPRGVTLSGLKASLEAVERQASARNIASVRLNVSHAFHSPLMEPILDALGAAAGQVRWLAPHTRLVSCLTGAAVEPGEMARPDYWRRQARRPVRFAQGVEALAALGCDAFVEIGPRAVLGGLARAVLGRTRPVLTLPSLARGQDDVRTLLESLARLYEAGLEVDWPAVNRGRGAKAGLPPTPFVRERHWLPPPSDGPAPAAATGEADADAPSPHVVVEQALPPLGGDYADHRVEGRPLLPAAGMLAACLAAAERAGLGDGVVVRDLAVLAPVELSGGVRLRTELRERAGVPQLELFARAHPAEAAARWTLAATASAPPLRHLPEAEATPADSDRWPQVASEEFYAALARRGLDYGPAFRPLGDVRVGGRAAGASARISLAHLDDAGVSLRRTVLLDGALQLLAAADGLAALVGPGQERYLPVGVEAGVLRERPAGPVRAFARLRGPSREAAPFLTGDVRLYDAAGQPCGALLGVSLRRLGGLAPEDGRQWLLRRDWRKLDPAEAAPPAAGERPLVIAAGPDAEDTPEAARGPAARIARACRTLLARVDRSERRTPARRLMVVTHGAVALSEAEAADPEQAALAAFAVGVAQERPGTRLTVVDVAAGAAGAAMGLAELERLLALPAGETLVAWRDGAAFVPRLATAPPPAGTADGGPVRLAPQQLGRLDSLGLRPAPPVRPGPGEVQIAVEAAGLNFRDLLKLLGAYPGMTEVRLGDECAGRVVAVGEGCTRVRPGDAVLAMAPGALASEVIAPEPFVVPLPGRLDVAEGAAVPVAFATAYRALVEVAQLQPGESVLIHAAAGGVGLAAVEIARTAGAEIYATVGGAAKRELLRARGVTRLFDSRSPSFVDEVRAATGGRGVDVVLNSLSGPLLALGVGLLAPFGRFIEIGKRDIFADTPVGLRAFKDNQTLASLDMEALVRRRPQHGAAILRRVVEGIDSGLWSPPPVTRFDASQAAQAFRLMARGEHQGKIALTFPAALRPAAPGPPPPSTHLVSGGLGALGLALAQHLGASRPAALLLCGRSAPGPEAERAIAAIRAAGVRVEARACDVADADAVSALLAEAAASLPPIRAVYHLAGALADGFTAEMDDAALLAPMRPKIDGAAHLDRLTRGLELDRFVLFSSVAGQVSPPGQANYAAANAYLDVLAGRRRAQGLPALSLAWGPWADGGMAARARRTARSASLFVPIEPAQAFALLDRLIDQEVAAAVVAMPRPAAFAALGARGAVPQALRELVPAAAAPAAAQAPAGAAPAAPDRRSPSEIVEAVVREIALVLDTPPEQLDRRAPLEDLGMDSLMALELTHRLETGYGVVLPRDLGSRSLSVDRIIDLARSDRLDRVRAAPVPSAASPTPEPPAGPGATAARLRRLERSARAGGAAERGRMICFCWAGGRAASFSAWVSRLPETELVVAEPPPADAGGAPDSVQALAEALAPRVAALVAPGTLLFGHSLGALVAFETARRIDPVLRDAGAALLVSGRDAPQIPPAGKDVALMDDRELVDYLARLGGTPQEILAEGGLLDQRLPTLRRDLMMARNYRFAQGEKLQCRLAAAYGVDDPQVSPAGMAAWQTQAAQTVAVSRFVGGHFYFRQHAAPLFALLKTLLPRQVALTPDAG